MGIVAVLLALLTLTSCSSAGKRYRIGVSQCSADIWRDKQNDELRMAAYFHEDIDLCFAAAYDSDERQIQQIDSLVDTGIDLLIVAPNQVETISPAIDRAYDKGIPVIVFERKTSSRKYTAFISADNYEMGRVMGEYVASQLQGKGNVMEIMGLEGSSPAIERHNGFADALKSYPGITTVATLQGDWTEESAVKAVNEYKGDLSNVDFVFGQNDRMAMGARRAIEAQTSHPSLREGHGVGSYCGIDGLTGKGGGIELVRDSLLEATYIYPTRGDEIIELAMKILKGEPYDKENKLKSALVTRSNASLILMQAEEIDRQSQYVSQLNKMADNYLSALNVQRVVTLLACIVIFLLVATFMLYYLYHRGKITLRRQRVVNTLWNMPDAEDEVLADSPNEDADDPSTLSPQPSSFFISRFREVVEARLADSDLSVEDLAADMNLSRVQLYRKVKSVTGSSPVELLRTARLNRGYQLLLTTDKTVSEVAYTVGFSAPSYFTKCFKDEFGMAPGDVRED